MYIHCMHYVTYIAAQKIKALTTRVLGYFNLDQHDSRCDLVNEVCHVYIGVRGKDGDLLCNWTAASSTVLLAQPVCSQPHPLPPHKHNAYYYYNHIYGTRVLFMSAWSRRIM